jgi:hypothetical protein
MNAREAVILASGVFPACIARILYEYDAKLTIYEKVKIFAGRHYRTVAHCKYVPICSCDHTTAYVKNLKLHRKHGNRHPVVFRIGLGRRWDYDMGIKEFANYLEVCAEMDANNAYPLGQIFRTMLANWLAGIE